MTNDRTALIEALERGTIRALSIRRTKLATSFVRTRCGNADGFYWGNWQVTWRIPYAKVWGFDGTRWVPAYTLKPGQRQ